MELKDQITEYCDRENVTLADVALKAEINYSMLYRFMKGQRDIYLSTALKILKAINECREAE
jgi:predicted transcriptional regulator